MSSPVAALIARFESRQPAPSSSAQTRPARRPPSSSASPAAHALRTILSNAATPPPEAAPVSVALPLQVHVTPPALAPPPASPPVPARLPKPPSIAKTSPPIRAYSQYGAHVVSAGKNGHTPALTPRRVSLPDVAKDASSLRPPLSSRRTSSSANTSVRVPDLPRSISSGAISTATTSVAAADVFQASAHPLHLPHLDAYLGTIEPPDFPNVADLVGPHEQVAWQQWVDFGRVGKNVPKRVDKSAQKGARQGLFPPMHLLPDGLTLADLKRNSRSPAPFLSLNQLLGTAIDGVLGGQGSSYASAFLTLELFRDLVQMLGLLVTNTGTAARAASERPTWQRVQLAVGLDFVSAFGWAFVWLGVFIAITAWAMFEFVRFSGGVRYHLRKRPVPVAEGLESVESATERSRMRWRDSRLYQISIVFLLSSLYLPMSKICIGALVWTSDFWPVENPYRTTDAPIFPPHPDGQRDPLDFCYRTSMRVTGFNWAYVVLPLVGATAIWLTCWFPLRLWNVVERSVPTPDAYTEMGERRTNLDAEYERLLERDQTSLAFMYNCYRRRWAGFKAIYMVVKLANMLCLTIFTKDNCIFRNQSRAHIDVVRTAVQLALMTIFLLLQILASPYIDLYSNSSDWCSRVTYVLVAGSGLLVALGVPGKAALGGPIILTITIISYFFNAYFAVIGMAFAQRFVKRIQCRLDASLDLFSPHLDLGKHIARRIWQEQFGVTLLAEADMRMAPDGTPVFVDAHVHEIGPYLANFRGTVGERHIENVKIIREIGLDRYAAAVLDDVSAASAHLRSLQRRIARDFVGPDCYWRPTRSASPLHVTTFFGRCWVVPFPFVLLFVYDQSFTLISIEDEADLAEFIAQQEMDEVLMAKRIRLALRALDGQLISAAYSRPASLSRSWLHSPFRPRHEYALQSTVRFHRARLRITRQSETCWRGYQYGSGFDVALSYTDGVDDHGNKGQKLTLVNADLGLADAIHLTPTLARILRDNRALIEQRLPYIEAALTEYRDFFRFNAAWKRQTLSYAFLLHVVGEDRLSREELDETLHATEPNPVVRQLQQRYPASFASLHARMRTVNRSKLNQWWFVYWDDVWRRNRDAISAFVQHPEVFSPHYASSVCYTPLPRSNLEELLSRHELWSANGRTRFFSTGVLNRIYFYLDEVAFDKTSRAVPLRVGTLRRPVDFDALDLNGAGYHVDDADSLLCGPAHFTGDASSHDDAIQHARPPFPFERLFAGDLASDASPWRRARRILAGWFGWAPLLHRVPPQATVYLRLRENTDGELQLPRSASSGGRRALAEECLASSSKTKARLA